MKLARHSLFNLVGLGAPLLLALASIPALLQGLGEARFGLLTLIWAVTSYFGLFDLGLGRALTLGLARRLAAGADGAALQALTGTALRLLLALGVVAAMVLALVAPWGVGLMRGVADEREALVATWCMALALPAITLTAGLRGALEAVHAFGWVNALRLPLGLWTFCGPWLVLAVWGADLVAMTLALLAGRWLGLIGHAWALHRSVPAAGLGQGGRRALLPELLSAGGWMTVSNVVSPLMGYADRFLIGGMVSATAVSWYATAQELVSKLSIVPGALTAVLFPAVAGAEPAPALFRRSLQALAALLLPLTAGLVAFAEPLLALWLNPGFAVHAAPLLQVFALGTFINCLAHIPFTYLQARDASRITAFIHLAELPFFLLLLVLAVGQWGVMGAVGAWLLRIGVDTLLMFAACQRLLGWSLRETLGPGLLLQLAAALLAFAAAWWAAPTEALAVIVLATLLAAWPCWPPVRAALRKTA
ncbi:oligosaccharide flippase family protein [Inhella sp.]|uniref:oligosaccharide flippase family protein n=1 Tax=Inhella sp. TaxID=1921806 RepID=UPI0035B264A9